MNVVTIGTFDQLHVGHVELLEACRRIAGDRPVCVGVNSDRFVARYKGRPAVQTQDQRMTVVRAVRYVDEVALNDQDELSGVGALLARWTPSILVIGDDWHPLTKYAAQIGVRTDVLASEYDAQVVFVPRTTGMSSTRLREGA